MNFNQYLVTDLNILSSEPVLLLISECKVTGEFKRGDDDHYLNSWLCTDTKMFLRRSDPFGPENTCYETV